MSTSHRLPKGARVLVTGATGLVGSATTEELVKRGYIVRAATRDASKTTLFAEKLGKLYGEGLFEVVEIKNFAAPGAYNKALEGVDGVAHIATDVSFSSNVDQVVGNAVDSTLGLLKAAAQSPQVKAFVLTSSRVAVYNPEYGKDAEWPLTTFADHFYDLAQNASDDDPLKPLFTYAASKVKAERAAWQFVEEEKPQFSLNVVLPDLVLGSPANPAKAVYSTSSWTTQLFKGDLSSPTIGFANPSANIVDVRDTALIHVAGLLAEDVNHERLWALAYPFHINDFLEIWREAYPDRVDTIPTDFDFPAPPKQKVDTSRSEQLLQRFAGRSWIDFKQTLVDNVRD